MVAGPWLQFEAGMHCAVSGRYHDSILVYISFLKYTMFCFPHAFKLYVDNWAVHAVIAKAASQRLRQKQLSAKWIDLQGGGGSSRWRSGAPQG